MRRPGLALAALLTILAACACGTPSKPQRYGSCGPILLAKHRYGCAPVGPPQTTNCFNSPSACGYPDLTSGAGSTTACGSLQTLTTGNVPAGWSISGSQLSPTTSGTSGSPNTLQGFNITSYWVYVGSYSYVKLENDCITVPGSTVPSGDSVIMQNGGTNLTVDHVTELPAGCSAASNTTSCSTTSSYEHGVAPGNNSAITNSVLADAEESVGAANNLTITGNYIIANGLMNATIGNHTEDIYANATTGVVIENNTILNPWDEQAAIFAEGPVNTNCSDQFTIKGNLIAGGINTLDLCVHSNDDGTNRPGTSSMDIENNHFARCLGTSTPSTGGGTYCAGGADPGATSPGSSIGAGQDTHGYFPNVGYGALVGHAYCTAPGWTWSGNVYDDNGAAVSC